MTKTEQMDKMARYLGVAVAVGILTKANAQVILDNFGKKIGYYK